MATGMYPLGSAYPYPYPRDKIIPVKKKLVPVYGYEIVPIHVPVWVKNSSDNPHPIRYPLNVY